MLAYALSVEQLMKRDVSRMRGFPNVNAGVQRILGNQAFTADKGHFLGHAREGFWTSIFSRNAAYFACTLMCTC